MELLRGIHFRLPHPDNQINFQRAVTSTRELALLLRKNVLDQLVFKKEDQLKAEGVRMKMGQGTFEGRPVLSRHYLVDGLFVFYGHTEDGPEEVLFIRKTDAARGQRVEISINRVDKIRILWAVDGAPRIAERLTLSASPTELWYKGATTCGHGTYKYTATPKSEYPAIQNYAEKIRCVTQQVAEVLSTV